MLVDASEAKRKNIYVVRLMLENTRYGNLRVDLTYVADIRKSLIVNFICAYKEKSLMLDKEKDELQKHLKDNGFNAQIGVFYNPKVVGVSSLFVGASLLEERA